MPQQECEPLGAAEMAAYLGVQKKTVHVWQQRGHMPPHDWIVNGHKAWNIDTVELFAYRNRGYSLEQLEECRRRWPELRESTRLDSPRRWINDPERVKAAEAKRQATLAEKAKKARKAAKKAPPKDE